MAKKTLLKRLGIRLGSLLGGLVERAALRRIASAPRGEPRLPAYLGDGRVLTTLSTGQPFTVDAQSLDLGLGLIRYGRWEDWITHHLAKYVLRMGDTAIIDAGANVGYFAVLLARLARGHQVWAFEPNRRLHSILRTNLAINGLDRTRAFDCALGAGDGVLPLLYRPFESGGGFLNAYADPDFEAQEAQIRALDDILPEGQRIGLMKIDVEGFEPQVLDGARRTIARSPDLMICLEVSPEGWKNAGYDPVAVLQDLVDQGFALRLSRPYSYALHPMAPADIIAEARSVTHALYVFALRDWSVMDGRPFYRDPGRPVESSRLRNYARALRAAVR